MRNNKGFTLIEILIVIAIIGILAIVVFVALNPAGRFADARNSNRVQNVESIGKAILQYNVDNNGSWPGSIPSLLTTPNASGFATTGNDDPQCNYSAVVAGDSVQNAANGCMWADDSTLSGLIAPKYLSSVPMDGSYHYYVALTPDGNHVVVMTNHMDTNGVSTNSSKDVVYYRTF